MTTQPDPATLKAWIGYASNGDPFRRSRGSSRRVCIAVRVCEKCPDRAKAEQLALTSGFAIDLTLCPSCYRDGLIAQKLETD